MLQNSTLNERKQRFFVSFLLTIYSHLFTIRITSSTTLTLVNMPNYTAVVCIFSLSDIFLASLCLIYYFLTKQKEKETDDIRYKKQMIKGTTRQSLQNLLFISCSFKNFSCSREICPTMLSSSMCKEE